MDLNNTCHGCGKPVYFAERKTSLGKNWHRHCLKCKECGKVVSPGQHAEHKGTPYCHNPCYGALFGPKILGFGSNITSPANFRKSSELNDSVDASNENNNTDGIKCIFKTTNTSSGPIKFLWSNTEDATPPKVFQKRHSSSGLETQSDSSSGYSSNSGSSTGLDVVSENSGSSSGLKCVYQSSGASTIKNKRQSAPVSRSHSDAGKFTAMAPRTSNKIRGPELFKKVQSYNEHHDNKRGQNLSILEEDGNVRVQGPLRIYWGLKKPIMLKQYDEVPAIPTTKKRLSVFTDSRELKPLPEITQDRDSTESPTAQRRNLDDSVISSPSSEVVMRRTNIKKSNTVAYRGDRSNKWKRASINGHIYNYDTSVFTPVLGSCTSVTVDNKMTVLQVITTLLEKFKVENEPDEYNLCIITEQEGERTLKATDIPLLERLVLGPSDSVKIFIRDRQEATATVVNPAHIPDGSSPTTETPPEEIPLPEEVEQLIDIPEPVLQGLLDKFRRDEEQEIRRLKNKYERIRKRVREIIAGKKVTASRC